MLGLWIALLAAFGVPTVIAVAACILSGRRDRQMRGE